MRVRSSATDRTSMGADAFRIDRSASPLTSGVWAVIAKARNITSSRSRH